ncbi:MAG: putative Ig domain-containing protein, partial [Clostridiales bacterium]|nr:putative Ig domain-containing protein [Clostridiales bacterium]
MKKSVKIVIAVLCSAWLISALGACGSSKSFQYEGAALAAGTVGVKYSASIGAADAPDTVAYALKPGSVLPAGLSLSGGLVVGTPSAKTDGAARFTVVASASGYSDAEAEYGITIAEGELSYTGARLTAAIVGQAYTATTATAAGGGNPVIAYALKSGGVLPDWLTFNGGLLSGTPTAKTAQDISFTVVASAADYASGEADFTLAVINAGELDYAGTALPVAAAGTVYSQSVATATGAGNPAITYALKDGDSLPAGLGLSAAGLITGTPAANGASAFTV